MIFAMRTASRSFSQLPAVTVCRCWITFGIRPSGGEANEEKIEHWLQSGAFSLVIDATHPYAKEVTANIKQACFRQGIRYLRLLRDLGDQSGALEFASAQKAAAYLANTQGNILLTIGSREIDVFAPLNKDQKRIFARILPAEDSIAACRRAGVTGRNLLCMQGPFSADFTYAALREFQCRFLVTKNSGSAGGFEEKMEAARRAGVQVLVIRRPRRRMDFLSIRYRHICWIIG